MTDNTQLEVGARYKSNDKRQADKQFTIVALADEVARLEDQNGKGRNVDVAKLESSYSFVGPAKKKPGRPATPLNVGSVWQRRHDEAQIEVIDFDEDAGTISTRLVGSDKTPSSSKLVFFRRRFQHVSG